MVSLTNVCEPGVPYVTFWLPPMIRSTDVFSLMTASRLTVPSMWSRNEWRPMRTPFAVWSWFVVFSRIWPLPLIVMIPKTSKFTPMFSWRTRPTSSWAVSK